MWEVELSDHAEQALFDLEPNLQDRIEAAIDQLQQTFMPHGAKKLQGRKDEYRLRVGAYRILYRVFKKEKLIVVGRIDRRGQAGIYR